MAPSPAQAIRRVSMKLLTQALPSFASTLAVIRSPFHSAEHPKLILPETIVLGHHKDKDPNLRRINKFILSQHYTSERRRAMPLKSLTNYLRSHLREHIPHGSRTSVQRPQPSAAAFRQSFTSIPQFSQSPKFVPRVPRVPFHPSEPQPPTTPAAARNFTPGIFFENQAERRKSSPHAPHSSQQGGRRTKITADWSTLRNVNFCS